MFRKIPRLRYIIPYLLLAYILSAGPFYWHIHAAYIAEGDSSDFLVRAFYFPLVLACESSDYIANFFDWYIMLWAFNG